MYGLRLVERSQDLEPVERSNLPPQDLSIVMLNGNLVSGDCSHRSTSEELKLTGLVAAHHYSSESPMAPSAELPAQIFSIQPVLRPLSHGGRGLDKAE